MRGLAEKGHDVTVISPFSQDRAVKNYHEITVLGVEQLIEGIRIASYSLDKS